MKTMKRKPKQREKPGPKEKRLIITEDPQTALNKLLRPKKTDETQKPDDTDKSG